MALLLGRVVIRDECLTMFPNLEWGETNAEVGILSSVTRYSDVTDDLDTVFDLLCVARRRYLLYYLNTMDGKVAELEAAVDAVCAYEAGGTDTDNTPSRAQVWTDLLHAQLPRLADAGVLDYDQRHGTIHVADAPSLEEWLDHAQYKELR